MSEKLKDGYRVALIGLDGATFDLFSPWIKQGKLPHLKRLLIESSYGEINSTIPCTTPVAWSTVYTGKNPGKHGIFDFHESYLMDRRRPLISSSSLKAVPIWRILNHYGKRAILFNVPMTFPPEPIDGIVVSGMMTPSEKSDFSNPGCIKNEILSRFPDYRVNIDIPKYDTEYIEGCYRFLNDLERSFSARRDALFYLMENHEWDFLFGVFILPDRIQHIFWKYIDPASNRFRRSGKGKRLYHRLLRLIQLLDEMIGLLSEKFGKDDYLYVISDHGFGGTEAYININTLLQRWGYLKLRRTAIFSKVFFKAWAAGENKTVKSIIPVSIQQLIRSSIRKRRSTFDSGLQNLIDFSRTKAFFASIASQGIFIESDSLSGADYDSIRENIKSHLYSLKDIDGRSGVVEKVYYREELYQGPFAKYAPDITFIANNYAYLGRQHIGASEKITSCREKPIGFHRPNGIFIARGPGIEKNRAVEAGNLLDIAPTILYSFDLPVPDDMDGKVITSIFQENVTANRPAVSTGSFEHQTAGGGVYTEQESDAIRRRLRDLGYIE